MQHTECYIKDYPRPQFVRKRWNKMCIRDRGPVYQSSCSEDEEGWLAEEQGVGQEVKIN